MSRFLCCLQLSGLRALLLTGAPVYSIQSIIRTWQAARQPVGFNWLTASIYIYSLYLANLLFYCYMDYLDFIWFADDLNALRFALALFLQYNLRIFWALTQSSNIVALQTLSASWKGYFRLSCWNEGDDSVVSPHRVTGHRGLEPGKGNSWRPTWGV